MDLVQGVVDGLLIGLVFALVASGLSVIFGMMEVVNFAHGEFLMLAMYSGYWMWAVFSLDPLVSWPLTMIGIAVLGVVVYIGLIRPLLKAPPMIQIFATFGLSVFLQGAAQFLWSPNVRRVGTSIVGDARIEAFGLVVGLAQTVAALACFFAFVALYWFMERTEFGRAMAATAADRQAAALMGINTEAMYAMSWAIGGACVGLAGGLLSNYFNVQPDTGVAFGLTSFVVVALGGFGSIPGALAGGILVGVVQVLSGLLIAPAFKYAAVLVLFLIVVTVRPRGLLGRW